MKGEDRCDQRLAHQGLQAFLATKAFDEKSKKALILVANWRRLEYTRRP